MIERKLNLELSNVFPRLKFLTGCGQFSDFSNKFHNNLLPIAFDTFFMRVSETHNYNTRLSSKISYSLPKVRTNYGIFNIRFQGPKLWNSISEDVKILSIWKFKAEIKCDYIKDY